MANVNCDRCNSPVVHDSAKKPTHDSPLTGVKVYCVECARTILGKENIRNLIVVAPQVAHIS